MWFIFRYVSFGLRVQPRYLKPAMIFLSNRVLSLSQIGKPGVNKKVIWIDATIHAREWIAIATIQKIIDYVRSRLLLPLVYIVSE